MALFLRHQGLSDAQRELMHVARGLGDAILPDN
jgi:hypothetical protein